MDKLFKIGQAAKALGVSPSTLRRWEREGKITPERTALLSGESVQKAPSFEKGGMGRIFI